MERGTIRDLEVDTVGHCFLCLNIIPAQLTLSKPSTCREPSSVHSLHHLSSFLQMDKRKVFKENTSIPDRLLAKVLKSKLKSALCMECTKLSDKFSKLYENLERIRIEMDDCLKQIHQKLRIVNELDRTELIQKLAYYGLELNEEELLEKLQIFEVLRTEVKQQCSRKMSSLLPVIKVERLTQHQISKVLEVRVKAKAGRTIINPVDPGNFPGSNHGRPEDDEIPNIKLERLSPVIASDGEGNDFRTGSDDDTNIDNNASPGMSRAPEPSRQSEKSERSKIKLLIARKKVIPGEAPIYNKTEVIPPPIILNEKVGQPRGQFILNPKTFKYECQHCPSVFTAVRNFYSHYKSMHLKIRYRCPLPLCQTEHSYRHNYERHYLAVHMEKKFKCQHSRTFNLQTSLDAHKKSIHQKRRYSCRVCSRTFANFYSRNKHTRNCSLQRINDIDQLQCKTENMTSESDDESRKDTDEHFQAALPSLNVGKNFGGPQGQ